MLVRRSESCADKCVVMMTESTTETLTSWGASSEVLMGRIAEEDFADL